MARREKKDNESEKTDAMRNEASAVKKWFLKIDHSKRYKKKASERYHWNGLTEKYRGYFAGLQDASDIYVPALNYIFAYIKAEIPRLALRDPKISINPKKGSSILSSKILQKAINYIWRTKKIKRENKKNLLDSLLVGHSWFKSGYTGKFGTIEDANGKQFEFIESEDFFGYRVPYENIYFSPEANDPPFDCTWIAQEVWVPLKDLQDNKSFKHTADLQVSSREDSGDSDNIDSIDGNRRFGPDAEMVKTYEVWDKIHGQLFTLAEGCEYFLRAPAKFPYDMKGFPFSFLRLNDDPRCPYGLPDCFMFEPQVMELIKIRAQELDHIKRFNRQLLLAEGHMSQDSKDQFSQGITGAVLEVQTNGRPLGDIVAPIPYPPIQTDIYAIEDRIQQDAVRISGQTFTEQGGTQKTATRSLGELNSMNEGASNRREDKIDTIEDFIEDIASNLVALLQQFADMPFYVSVVGDEMQDMIKELENRPSAKNPKAVLGSNGFTFTKEDIQGEFDFEVVPGSTKPFDSAQKMATLMEILEKLPKLGIQPGPVTQYIGTEIAEQLDMAGFTKAVNDEIEATKQRIASAEAQQNQQTQLMVAQNAADTQIKAEREATKQQELQLKAAEMFNMHGGNDKEAPVEDKGPSESISFKDLPPEGQVQMARQAGINLTAEQAKAHIEAQKPAKPVQPSGK